jgi:hypothetical protein
VEQAVAGCDGVLCVFGDWLGWLSVGLTVLLAFVAALADRGREQEVPPA